MALCALPRFIVLKSQKNDKYLIHQRDDQDYLQFSGTDFASLHVKFEVVRSSTVDGLVHLKCCYNNKYWVCRPNQHWITAEAREMEEDQTKWSCTLFKPEFFTSNRIRFYHVHIKTNVMFQEAKPHYLGVGKTSNEADYLNFFDWESLPILPRYIVLKGYNGNYLSACMVPQNFNPYPKQWPGIRKYVSPGHLIDYSIARYLENRTVFLRFNCKDKGDHSVANEVFTTPDGNIRLKSNLTGKFWRCHNSGYINTWITPDSEDETNNNTETLFKVIKVSHNKIALKNLSNNMFCMSLTTDNLAKIDCLIALSSTIPETAKFLVEEIVDKRQIFRVCFHEEAARIYEKQISHEVKSTDINHTEVVQQGTLEFEYTKEESQTWTTSNSLKQSAETEITFGTPKVGQGKLKFAKEETTTVQDGKTLAIKIVQKYTKTVNVPPMSKIVAKFRVIQALCDIPYSYSQTETLNNGTIVTTDKDDGLYTCVHTEVFFQAKQEKISSMSMYVHTEVFFQAKEEKISSMSTYLIQHTAIYNFSFYIVSFSLLISFFLFLIKSI